MATINGKKPISEKKTSPQIMAEEDLFGNFLSLDPALKKEIEDQGLVYRFISAPKLQNDGGFHRFGWTPYKRKSGTMDSNQDHLFGKNPDGFIRRGEMVLAVRNKELNEKHKAYLNQEANRASGVAKTRAAELREAYKGRIAVTEGYEDESEEQ